MTGFGRLEAQLPEAALQWEVRSVNHRYLDVQFRLPEGFRDIEHEFRQIVAGAVGRGKVEATLSIKRSSEQAAVTRVDAAFSKQIIDHLEDLAASMKTPAPVSPVAVLRWPGVLEEEDFDAKILFPAASEALRSTVVEFSESRAREGKKIRDMLEKRCAEIDVLVGEVRKRLPEVLVEIRNKLDQRIESLKVQLDNDRLEQELAILAQKIDVSEELDRLVAHIEEVRTVLDSAEPVGRRLDFLMQELNREANTLGSKSADTQTTKQAVDLKVLIEQMREQVQNVE
jgi:uncharacterized protein (TIGR00255 family)